MQAIARVNRIFKDKPGGLIVDYIGVADDLKKALSIYSSGIQKEAMVPIEEIIAKMMEKYDIVRAMFSGVEYKEWKKLLPTPTCLPARQGLRQAGNGNGELKELVRELVKIIKRDLAIDWMNNDIIKARIRANVKLLLLQKGLKPEESEGMLDLIYQQAFSLYGDFIPAGY